MGWVAMREVDVEVRSGYGGGRGKEERGETAGRRRRKTCQVRCLDLADMTRIRLEPNGFESGFLTPALDLLEETGKLRAKLLIPIEQIYGLHAHSGEFCSMIRDPTKDYWGG